MKKCLRKKCQKEFEPNKPKQIFCSAKCRVYFSREENNIEVKDLGIPTNKKEPPKSDGSQKGNNDSIIPPIPQKSDFKDSFEFAAAKSEWKLKHNQQ